MLPGSPFTQCSHIPQVKLQITILSGIAPEDSNTLRLEKSATLETVSGNSIWLVVYDQLPI